jgi:hypothetical protein
MIRKIGHVALNASGTGSASYTAVPIYPLCIGSTIMRDFNLPSIDSNKDDHSFNFDGQTCRCKMLSLTLTEFSFDYV